MEEHSSLLKNEDFKTTPVDPAVLDKLVDHLTIIQYQQINKYPIGLKQAIFKRASDLLKRGRGVDLGKQE
jgi:hypothetical protein